MRTAPLFLLPLGVACGAHKAAVAPPVPAAVTTSAPAPAPGPVAVPDLAAALSGVQLVDLSHPFDDTTLYWPTSPSAFELMSIFQGQTEGGFYYSANTFCTPEHGGTHLDAPVHFAEGGQSTDEVPLETLVGPAVVVDVRAQAQADPDYRLTVADLEAWEAEHGAVPRGAMVLLQTGWSKRWPDRKAYFGDDTPGDASNLHFPSFGAAAVEVLIEQRGASVLGLDTPSIDHGPSDHFLVHQSAGAADVPGLENLTNLDQLPPTGAWVMALPMKITGGSGGPARVVAMVP